MLFTHLLIPSMKRLLVSLLNKHPTLKHFIKQLLTAKNDHKNRPIIKNSGKNNQVITSGASLSNVVVEIDGDNNRIELMPGSSLTNVNIYTRGNNCRLNFGKSVMGSGTLSVGGHGAKLIVGDNNNIGDAKIVATEGKTLRIGNGCLFSYYIDMRTSDAHSIYDRTSGERINHARDIVIGDHVWIGMYAQILKGATVREGSIVGIRSVVGGDVPAHCIVAGIPAKVLRENVRWDNAL